MEELDEDLVTCVADLLDLDQNEVQTNSELTFIELGGDSVKALELTFRLDAAGKVLDFETIMEEESNMLVLSRALPSSTENTSDTDSDATPQSLSDLDTPSTISSNADYNDDPPDQVTETPATAIKEASKQIGCRVDQIEQILSLTSQQRGLWLGSLTSSGSYISRWHYSLPQTVDLRKLRKSCERVLRSTPILRTRIVLLNDIPHQAVLNYNHYETRSVPDVPECPQITAEHGALLFQFGIESRKNKKYLHLVCHHALYDKWSMKLIIQDVRYAYYHDKLPQPRPSYSPLLEPVKEAKLSKLTQLWCSEVGDEPLVPAPHLKPLERSPDASQSLNTTVKLMSPLQMTKAELIAAAWSLVCSKHTNESRVSFGVTVSGRDIPHPGITDMAFPTFHTLPFCAVLSENDTVSEFVSRTKSRFRLLRRTQQLDIDAISTLGPTYRESCRFNSILVIQQEVARTKEDDSDLLGAGHLISFSTRQSNPLVLECTPSKNEIEFCMRYDPDSIITADAETLLRHLETAIEAISTGGSSPLVDVSLFNEHDKQQIIKWTAPHLAPINRTLHSVLKDQAAKTPDSIALWSTDLSLTYSDMMAQASKIMAKTRALNSRTGMNIGVCFEKSVFAVVAMVGISMAGNTFIPMDASNPLDRLMQLVEDAEIHQIFCSQSMASKFEGKNVDLLVIDEQTISELPVPEDDRSDPSVSPDSNVYIIYTSGSTGKPKGVVTTHKALCTTIQAIAEHLEFSEETRSLQFSSFAFDMSAHDIWCTFSTGGVVCMPSEEERFDLEDFIYRAKCNYAMLTPSVAATLSEKSWKAFKKLSVSGEPVTRAVITGALQAGVKFWNTYGPTESCIICHTEQVKSTKTSTSRLGYSMAAVSWVMDAKDPNRLAPVGCIGEMALTGPTLAREYYRDVEKTDKAFVKDLAWTKLFPDHAIDKVYRTGDLARYNSDGSIEFQGRSGGYIKIAGNRLDLGEIENTLHSRCELPRVSVQYCKVGKEDSRDLLICFRSFPSKEGPKESEILPMTDEKKQLFTASFAKLRDMLPSYMIPAACVPVSIFPHNVAGKLDRRRLIALIASNDVDSIMSEYGIDVPEPQTTEELSDENEAKEEQAAKVSVLKDCWARVLRLSSSSITNQSHFFRLGGDSLRAMNLGASVRREGYVLRVPDVFRYPTLKDMASQLAQGDQKDDRQAPTEKTKVEFWNSDQYKRISNTVCKKLQLKQAEIEALLPCSSLQTQMLAATEQSPGSYLHRECFELQSSISEDEIQDLWRNMMKENELLRSRATVDDESGQFVLATLTTNSAVKPRTEQGSLQAYIQNANPASVGIDRSLCQFILLKDGGTRYLIWEMHHCIYDGYSYPLLLKQIQRFIQIHREEYEPRNLGSQSSTPFGDYLRYVACADKQKAKDFWFGYLEGASELVLNFKKQRACRSPTNSRLFREVDLERKQSNFTWATYIKTAFAHMLSRYSNTYDVTFSTTLHGRDLPVRGIEEMTGPTFSTLPVRCQIDRQGSLGKLMSKVQDEAAEVATHQYLSVDEISRLSSSCKQACQFDVHLLVQSAASDPPYSELESLGYKTVRTVPPMDLQIPLNLVATVKEHKVHLEMIYNDSVFSSEHAKILLDQFIASLSQIVKLDETSAVKEIRDLGEENKTKIVSIQPRQDHSVDTTIPELVFRDLNRRRQDQALYSTESTFTYLELHEYCTKLAQIISHKVESDNAFIAIYFEKSSCAIAAQLAVLMSGHAYVSIDASWPLSRQRDILAQIKSPLIITSSSMKSTTQELNIPTIIADAADVNNSAPSDTQTIRNANPDHPAYIIYTSGSTGTPKGVVVKHSSICRTLLAYANRLTFTSKTRALLFASFAFDASVMETWSVLVAGGTLCVPDEEERIGNLDAFINESKSDCVGLTPTAASLLDPKQQKHIKTLLFCGEKCHPRDLERWTDRDTVLVNAYGPSEASVNAVMNTHFTQTDISNIGHSMGGGLWVANPDDHNALVPVGGVGELLITGPVLAAEYLGDREKTAEKFVYPKWPGWTKINKQRAYKTGDLVWLDTDGCLRFVGRHDGQMKVNGIRIEPSEIESIIHKSEVNVRDVVAGPCYLDKEQSELALYFVPHDQPKRSDVEPLSLRREHPQLITQLHELLTDVLPESHVPKLYIPVSAIPQSVSGKIDRKTLSQLTLQLHSSQISLYRRSGDADNTSSTPTTRNHSPARQPDMSPMTSNEKNLLSLWEQVIHRDSSAGPITQDSHFVRSGGDSVAAIRMSSLARSQGINLPVSTIYAHPVLRDMAKAVEEEEESQETEVEVLTTPVPFELLDGIDVSPVLSRQSAKGQGGADDYFGAAKV